VREGLEVRDGERVGSRLRLYRHCIQYEKGVILQRRRWRRLIFVRLSRAPPHLLTSLTFSPTRLFLVLFICFCSLLFLAAAAWGPTAYLSSFFCRFSFFCCKYPSQLPPFNSRRHVSSLLRAAWSLGNSGDHPQCITTALSPIVLHFTLSPFD
jgi:hypothetical protein